MVLEVIATSAADVHIAAENGADRIELISGIMEGGVTPSKGLIAQAVKASNIPVQVMIRPHANHFCYDKDDVAVMKEDIATAKALGAAGIVLGALTEEGKVDEAVLEELLEEAGELSVTFHRAFDEIDHQMEALEILHKYPQIDRVLTSGGAASVLDAEERIKQMVQWSEKGSLSILAGSGLTLDTLEAFIDQTGVKEVHLGRSVRKNGHQLETLDPQKVRAAAEIVRRCEQRASFF